MAYGQRSNGSNGQGGYAGSKPQAPRADGGKPTYEKDPNEVGIAYLKTSEKGGTYFSVSITADIPAGAKVMIFENNTKNRTEKTPTHVLKLSNIKK